MSKRDERQNALQQTDRLGFLAFDEIRIILSDVSYRPALEGLGMIASQITRILEGLTISLSADHQSRPWLPELPRSSPLYRSLKVSCAQVVQGFMAMVRYSHTSEKMMPTSRQPDKCLELFGAAFGNTVSGEIIRNIAQGARTIHRTQHLPRMNPVTEPPPIFFTVEAHNPLRSRREALETQRADCRNICKLGCGCPYRTQETN